MKNEIEYLIDLKKLDRFESIAFQKAYEKVKKNIRVFEAELRSKIASEIKKEEIDKIKKRLEKNITVRLEKQYKDKYDSKLKELDSLIYTNEEEKKRLNSQWKYVDEIRSKQKMSKFNRYKFEVKEALEYRLKHPDITIRELHKKFVPEISLSTFHNYTKRFEVIKNE